MSNLSIFCLYRIGAAISVRYPQTMTEVYSKILYNRLCFLVYQFPKMPPDEWNVSGQPGISLENFV